MPLLGWHVLRPHNSLAAIRYSALVRVSSIRVFPTGAQPFSQSPETVALTEPSAFFADVLFNASPTTTADGQDKRVARNALAPTQIAYAGEATEFVVDMGSEYATRLIIFRGDFEVISVAVYGNVVVEPPEEHGYEPKQLPVTATTRLSSSADVANATNPTHLAEKLLALLPVPPPLPLVSRLIFSLKPQDDDWDHPEFPYLYSDLDHEDINDLENLVQSVTRPIRDDISPDILSSFATKAHDCIGSNLPDDAYYAAKLLVKAASQQTRICLTILQHLDLPKIFNDHTLDDATIDLLLDASANIEISRYFMEDGEFFTSLSDMQVNPKTDKLNAKALKKLITRIKGWQTFEDALTNPTADFEAAAAFLKDISSDEHALGCWLECMLTNDKLTSTLQGIAIPDSTPLPPLLFHERHTPITQPRFITFVRALLGVSAVLAALSWSDSIGIGLCRERVLSLLALWQGVDGYREILNHCLLLRQLTKRLGWNKTDDVPTKSGYFAERLLVGLAKDPQSLLREPLVETILALKPPFSFIESEELLEMGKLARVGRDGLPSAIEELTYTSVRPFSLRRLRVLRVSLAILEEELSYDDGELLVVESFWDEKNQGVIPTLTSIVASVADDVGHHFVLVAPPRNNQALCELLFRTADDLLRLLDRFVLVYHPAGRDLRRLTTAVADLYACSRIACEQFTPSSTAYTGILNIRQRCTHVLQTLININGEPAQLDISNTQIVLRTLFNHASNPSNRDPVVHLLQIYDLVGTILPQPPTISNGMDDSVHPSELISLVIPEILPELRAFWDLLDAESRADFVERLEEQDHGEIGIGEWLLSEELKNLSTRLAELTGLEQFRDGSRAVILYGISCSMSFLDHLMASPTMSSWTLFALATNTDLSQLLENCLSSIINVNIYSGSITQVIRKFGRHADNFSPDIRLYILLLLLRSAQLDPSVVDALDDLPTILKSLPSATISIEPLRIGVGRMLSAYSEHAVNLQVYNSEKLFSILEWLAAHADSKLTTLVAITKESFQYLCSMLAASLPAGNQDALINIEGRLTFDEDADFAYPPTELPDSLVLPLDTVERLLDPKTEGPPSTPKRGTKTPDILGVVISPPTAVLRSPAATGLTKTYANNDFRQLRQVTSTRLNTSRLPSTHVDDFENVTESPPGLLAAVQIDPQIQAGLVFTGTSGLLPLTGL